jgi:carbamoyltransferase
VLVGFHRSHEASVAVLDDRGRPTFAASEERFSRIKMQGGWPQITARHVAAHYDVSGARAVHGGLPLLQRFPREAQLALYNATHGKLQDVHPKRFRKLADVAFGRAGGSESEVFPGLERTHVDHHTCHAASAYYPSGFDEAEVVTVDGVGDTYSARVFHGKGGALIPRAQRFHTAFPLGHNYEYMTALLGFHPHRHAGKVTGLSAHGSRDERLLRVLETWLERVWSSREGRPYFFMLHSQHGSTEGDAAFDQAIRELRELRQTLFGDWSNMDLAWAIQYLLEREVTKFIETTIPRIDGQPICLAGGVFANVKLNKLVKEMGFGQIFVQPAMGDGGLAFGAPLYELAQRDGLSPYRLESVYLGPEYGEDEMLLAIRDSGLEPRRYDEVEPVIAKLLAQGRVVARFNGRMEFGPRSLGNRSILYHRPGDDRGCGRRQLRRALGRGAHGRVHDHHERLHRALPPRVPGGRPRRRHRPTPDRAGRDEPLLPPRPRGVPRPHRRRHGREHLVQHARGADRLHAGRRRPQLRARSSGLSRDRALHRREPEARAGGGRTAPSPQRTMSRLGRARRARAP